jgi:hypothetical protein
MALLCVGIFSNNFGTIVEVKHMSTKDALQRRKCTGV